MYRRFLGKHLSLCRRSDPDVYFPEGRARFLRRLFHWWFVVWMGRAVTWNGPERLTILLLNYRRPWNMEALIRSFLCCAFVERVLIWDNGTLPSTERALARGDARVRVYGTGENHGTIARFRMARCSGGRHFLAVDDDVFLFPLQVRALFTHLVNDPSRVHGVVGQEVHGAGEAFRGLEEYAGPIDVLSRVYAFTQEHLNEFFHLLECLGIRDEAQFQELTAGDDIVLSFCGTGKPACHYVGKILSCPTCALPGTAVFREPGFLGYRSKLFRQLCSLPSPRSRSQHCAYASGVPGCV